VPDGDFPNVLRILMYLYERDHMHAFHNLIMQHTAVVVLIRVEAVEKVAVFCRDTLQYTDVSYDSENKLFRS